MKTRAEALVLPVDAILPDVVQSLSVCPRALLQAPPGAGKTTRVPLALLDASWLGGKRVLMLEPRRLAARAAARRMAATLGEDVGQTVGYRVRFDSRVSAATRIEVVTEGILTRMLQDDPELAGVGCVLFDEFHERSLQADVGLALALDCQDGLRPDLRIMLMSATLDDAPASRLLGDCPVIRSEGRMFAVDVVYDAPRRGHELRLEDRVAQAVRRALHEQEGSVLVFLPGVGEICRVEERLAAAAAPDVDVRPLYGDLSPQAQDDAIAPPQPGRRKVVLATAIAETSLTIEGVRVVVDAGLARVVRFDPRSGMSRLVTERVSLAGAEQRRGRAGRLCPGVCYRLWTEAEHGALRPFARPEILEADLAPLVLELAVWGVADCASLRWLDAPPEAHLVQARALLAQLGALDAKGRLTAHGRDVAGLPLHPRLAHMVIAAHKRGHGRLACVVAALLTERDGPRQTLCDMRLRVAAHVHGARGGGARVPERLSKHVADAARQVERMLAQVSGCAAGTHDTVDAQSIKRGVGASAFTIDVEATGEVLALAYPDRIAQARGQGGFRLANGRGAFLPPEDPLAAEPFLAIAELDGDGARARIWRAAPLQRDVLEELFAHTVQEGTFVVWDARSEAVVARRQRRVGGLVLEDVPLQDVAADTVEAVVDGIRQLGVACLPWSDELLQWRARVALLRRLDMESLRDAKEAGATASSGAEGGVSVWPDVSDEALLAGLGQWLGPFLAGITRRAHFRQIDLAAALHGMLDWDVARRLDAEAPTHLEVPSGSRVLLDYVPEGGPVLAVKLQEMFGAQETPVIAGGRVAVLVHLLSPAGRPLQVTRDLAGFWRGSYAAVRAEMRGRYPKHPWPDDPAHATPTRLTKKRLQGG